VQIISPAEFAGHRTALLTLRRDAYRRVGAVPQEAQVDDCADEFDGYSHFVAVFHRETMAGSLRVTKHPEGGRWAFESMFPFGKELPPKNNMVEVSKVCVLNEYRKSPVTRLLFAYCAKLTVELGCDFLLGSSSVALAPMYRRVGCRPIGVKFVHEPSGLESIAFTANARAVLNGSGVSPFVWSLVFSEAHEDLLRRAKLPVRSTAERVRGRVLRALKGPLRYAALLAGGR